MLESVNYFHHYDSTGHPFTDCGYLGTTYKPTIFGQPIEAITTSMLYQPMFTVIFCCANINVSLFFQRKKAHGVIEYA